MATDGDLVPQMPTERLTPNLAGGRGLRIMPHSGGRVGSGIYLASENGKSSGYDCDR